MAHAHRIAHANRVAHAGPSGARGDWATAEHFPFPLTLRHRYADIHIHNRERLLLNQWYIFSNTPNRGIYLRNDFFCLSSRRKSMWIDFFSVDISPLVRFYRRASRESERVKQIFGRSRGSPCRREKTFQTDSFFPAYPGALYAI